MSSLEEQLKSQRKKLHPTSTIVTTPTGERYLESTTTTNEKTILKLENADYGFVEDTKPDKIPAEILQEFLYLGSQDAVSIENIQFYKFTHILSVGVNATPHWESNRPPPSIEHKYLPLLDLPETELFKENFMEEAFGFINKARSLNGGAVLVHCNAGVSRAASVVIAYLMANENMSFDKAYNLVKSKREYIQPNAGFMRQLRAFNPKDNAAEV